MIDSFRGEYRFLSNFYPARVVVDDVVYPTVEHAYQAAKTIKRDERARIVGMGVVEAKHFGHTIQSRFDWEQIKLDVMLDLLRQKFAVEPLRNKLLATENQDLIEGNWWGDRFWGVCNGKGQNHLGRLLMRVRDELRTQGAAP